MDEDIRLTGVPHHVRTYAGGAEEAFGFFDKDEGCGITVTDPRGPPPLPRRVAAPPDAASSCARSYRGGSTSSQRC